MEILVLQDTTAIFLEQNRIETQDLLVQKWGQYILQLFLIFTSNICHRKET